jgi:hypothetical protein
VAGTTAPLAANAATAATPAAPPVKRAQRYECAGVSFALPADWEDVTSFVARGPGAEPLILKVARDRMEPSATLWSHVANVVVKLGREIPGFELQESSHVDVAGRPGVILRFTLAAAAGTFEQYLVLLDPLDDPERRVSVFNMSGPVAQSAMMREALGNILRSLRMPGQQPSMPGPPVGAKPTAPDCRVPMPGFRER